VNPTQGVLSEAWAMYKAHWRTLLPIAFVVYLALSVINLLLVTTLTWFGAILGTIVALVGVFWLQGALVRAVEDVRDGRADLSLGDTFERVRPQLASIVVGGLLAAVGILIGLALLIVPGLVLLTWWVLVIPVIVLEGRRAGEAFTRSRELVRGHGWSVFGVIVLTLLIVIGFGIVLSLVLLPVSAWLRSFVSNVVSGTLVAPFIALTWTLLYYRLRAALCQLSIPVGDRARDMRPPAQAHLVPVDLDVRVVVRVLGELADAVHERERLGEVGEAELALESAVHLGPSGWDVVHVEHKVPRNERKGAE
jgi:Membrane domain of glycerophosphoryl diester phosphodiesterase